MLIWIGIIYSCISGNSLFPADHCEKKKQIYFQNSTKILLL